MKLRELIEKFSENPQDVDLYHYDVDDEAATMVDLSMKDFTEEGLERFANALDAEVVKIRTNGENWVSVFVKGCSNKDVRELSLSHAGYCSCKDYDRWFVE
jgi:hypothetical protein